MKRISFTMHIDADGKITVKEILTYIIQNLPEIKAPDTDIMQIPLAALTLSEDNTKHCIDGEAHAKKWKDGRYTEYEITLIFGLIDVNKEKYKASDKRKCYLLLLLENGGAHMRITTYKTELNADNLNTLVKEKSCNCTGIETLNNPSLIAEMFNVVFRLNRQTEEYLYMLALTTKGKPLGVFEVSHGIIDATICNPREIFIKALLCGASGIVIVHNHPSGDTTPSKQDIESYNRLKEAGKLIGINVLDSIIVGESYYSFMENGI